MDRSIQFTLLPVTRTQDAIGQFVESATPRLVYGQITSVSAEEFFSGGQNGFRPEYRVTMFAYDYEGERRCLIDNVEYSIYRTYYGRTDKVELYLERRVGD
ncbi:MAG: hypothetical protein II008_03020 [Oscillospiraceae bacterium]|nr:hypothetical protein [Oscillospiraceae bacterium]